MFASNTDIQAWLQSDKIKVDDARSQKPNIEATRTIKSQLAGLFTPVVLASWDVPDNTPPIIRSIAGRLTAAYMYSGIYSEETGDIPEYAQWLYDGAISMLAEIKAGNLVVVLEDDTPVDTTGAAMLGFWPNDDVPPKFTMDKEFA